MRRAIVLTALLTAMIAGDAHASPAWLGAGALSAAGADSANPAIAMAPDGTVIVVWHRGGEMQWSARPAGGTFSQPLRASTTGAATGPPDVAVDTQGNAIAVWTESEGSIQRTVRAFRPAGGSFSDPKVISVAGFYTGNPRVVISAAGDALAIWQEGDGVTQRVGAAFRPAGGDFGEAEPLGGAGAGGNGLDAAFDSQGNALVVWSREASGGNSVTESVFRPAGGTFGSVKKVGGPADHSADPAAAFDPSGNAVVAFLLWNAALPGWRAYTAYRPAGGDFEAALPLSAAEKEAVAPRIAVDDAGEATVVFSYGFQPWAAIRPPGGSFGEPVLLSPPAHDAYLPAIAVDPAGRTYVIWAGNDGTGYKPRAVTRAPGGAFSEMQTLSDKLGINNGANSASPRIAADADGNAAATWVRAEGDDDLVEVAGYDGAGPRITDITTPVASTVGVAGSFGATVVDVWSPFSASWNFGDGASAAGAQATHPYTAPGAFTARLTATDDLGNATSAERAVQVGAVAVDRDAPVLSRFTLSPRRFRAAARGASLATAAGSKLKFTLSEPASVRFAVQRAKAGRRVRGTCRRTTAANRRKRHCTRYVRVGSTFTTNAAAGQNQRRFSGRVRGRKLKPGRYRLVLTATDAAGNRSAPARVLFRIVRR
jgi:hypothetical protein